MNSLFTSGALVMTHAELSLPLGQCPFCAGNFVEIWRGTTGVFAPSYLKPSHHVGLTIVHRNIRFYRENDHWQKLVV